MNVGSLAASVGLRPLIFAAIVGSKPLLFASRSNLVCGPLQLGGVNATLSGRTICLSVEASAGVINLMLPHIMAADR
jgi:hypothetical protein